MIKQVFWKEVRERIKHSNPDLVKIIDDICPDDKHYFYWVEYPYGSHIVDKGVFHLPNKEEHIVPINHSTLSNKIKVDLGYSGTIPLGLVLKNSIEAFMCNKEKIIPSSMVKAGQFISLWRVLDEGISYHVGRFWNITSGARSICMMPKITDTSQYRMLKTKYALKSHVPQNLTEHWELFTSIATHSNFTQPWKSGVLFFPEHWMAHKKDKKWAEFYCFLFNTVWQSSAFRRNQFIFDFAFSLAQENRNLRPNPRLADIVRHLVAIGSRAIPAFAPATDDSTAPIRGLQKVYLEDYGLKKYAPVILSLHNLSPHDKSPVYYSFQMPTTTIFSPKSRKLLSTMSGMQEVSHIMETLLSEILRGNLEIENTPLFEMAKSIKYHYFHSEKDKMNEISPANQIIKLDQNFTKTMINDEEYTFPEFAPFFRGCISISNTS